MDERRRLCRSEPDGRQAGNLLWPIAPGGKSELRRAVCRVIPGQGDLKESGTEKIPPRLICLGKGEKVR